MHRLPFRAEPVVLDTNAVLDWRLFIDPRIGALRQALDAGRLRWLATAAMLDELQHVLGRPMPARWNPKRGHVLSELGSTVFDLAEPPPSPVHGLHCTDRDDQKFLDLALHRGVRWLVTRDRALLSLRRRAETLGLAIVQPQHWRPPAPATGA